MGNYLFTDDKESFKNLPVIGRLRRPVKFLLNVIVWGTIAYWTIRLFHLRVNFQPFAIDSKISKTSFTFQLNVAIRTHCSVVSCTGQYVY